MHNIIWNYIYILPQINYSIVAIAILYWSNGPYIHYYFLNNTHLIQTYGARNTDSRDTQK